MQNDLENKEIKIIGVTGGIGTGKSVVAQMMSEFGGIVLDADAIYNQLIKQGEVAYIDIVKNFGETILTPDGEIDKKKLSSIVFNDREKLILLNKITHKHVGDVVHQKVDEIKQELKNKENDDLAFIVLDVPLPVEYGFFDLVNLVVAVVADADTRIERIMKRNNVSEEEAQKRIDAQMSNREYEEIADYIIENETDIETLKKNVSHALGKYFKLI